MSFVDLIEVRYALVIRRPKTPTMGRDRDFSSGLSDSAKIMYAVSVPFCCTLSQSWDVLLSNILVLGPTSKKIEPTFAARSALYEKLE